jgi:hypothetical protein
MRAGDRLAQFRSEWPRHVSWSEVRAEEPHVFRSAAQGVLLTVPAVAATLLSSSLFWEFPAPLPLPVWLDWMRGLLIVASLFCSIGLWIWASALLSIPGDVRRGIAIARFARERGLMSSRHGFAPERQGILLAEGRDAPRPRPARPRADPTRRSSFRVGFALWQSAGSPLPSLQIAIVSYTGGKNDPKGPRHTFRYMEMALPRRLPHIMIDARGNGSLRPLLPGGQRLSLEGDFDRYFSVYVPTGYEQDALELLTPDVMACLIDHGRRWDIEIVDDRLVVASHRFRRVSDRAEYTAMLLFSELIGGELGDQARTYSDPRAARPRSQVAAAGTRLRLRSAAWTAAAFAAAVGVMLAFPHVLGWLLDR